MLKKRITVVAVLAPAVGILFLTFQGPAETNYLTQKAQGVLEQIGIHFEEKPLRHYIHYVMYFVLGLTACTLCLANTWKLSAGLLIGCSIGAVDEGIKVLLPTREFDVTDLMRDFAGVAVAVLVVVAICKFRRRDVTDSGSKT